MKSQTLSQFQSVMQELDTFGRGKDKAKRRSRKGSQALTNTLGAMGVKKVNGKTLNTDNRKKNTLKVAGAVGAGGAGLAGAGIYGSRAAKQMGVEKKAVEASSKAAADAKKAFETSTRTASKKAFQRKTAQKLGQEAAKTADAFIEKGGIGKRAVGIAKDDVKKVASKASAVGAKVLGKILRRGK